MSESTIQILMLAATILWPRSVLRFSFACGLRPVFLIHTILPKRWKGEEVSSSLPPPLACAKVTTSSPPLACVKVEKGDRESCNPHSTLGSKGGEGAESVTHSPPLTGLKVEEGGWLQLTPPPPLPPVKVEEGGEVRTPPPPLETTKGEGGWVRTPPAPLATS